MLHSVADFPPYSQFFLSPSLRLSCPCICQKTPLSLSQCSQIQKHLPLHTPTKYRIPSFSFPLASPHFSILAISIPPKFPSLFFQHLNSFPSPPQLLNKPSAFFLLYCLLQTSSPLQFDSLSKLSDQFSHTPSIWKCCVLSLTLPPPPPFLFPSNQTIHETQPL